MTKPIEIWHPKYSNNTVLIATYKVSNGINRIKFTKAHSLEGNVYKVDGKKIKTCEIINNGKISCYEVPMSYLELEGA